MNYEFTPEELKQVEEIKSRFPEVKPATLPVLWLAQKKFGHVDPDVQKLVARTLGLSEAHVYGVAEFYTQYYKEEQGKFVLDVCTCLTCQVCGGYDILHHIEDRLGIKNGETTEDKMFTVKQVECLGACGYAPMMQITNGVYVNHLTKEKVDKVIDGLKNGMLPEFEPMKMRKANSQEN